MVKHVFRTSSAFKTSTIVDDTFSGHVNIFDHNNRNKQKSEQLKHDAKDDKPKTHLDTCPFIKTCYIGPGL